MAMDIAKAEQKAFKKFLVQRTILDSFRLYLDMSAKFIHKMEESKLLTKDELFLVKELGWPSNRNEFLKILVKKPWTKQDFQKFSHILKETQHVKLSGEISQKAEDFLKDALSSDASTMMTSRTGPHTPATSLNSGALAAIPLAARTQVLGLLRDRDERIYEQSREIERLHARVGALTGELDTTRRQLHMLDKEVTATLAVIGVESDTGHSSCEQGMMELRERFLRQAAAVQCLRADLEHAQADKAQLKDKLSVVIEDSIRSKKINADWAASYNSLKRSTDEDIKSLRSRVSSQEQQLAEARRDHGDLSAQHVSGTSAYQHEVASLRQRVSASELSARQAVQTRDRAVAELLRMKDDTRKLLKSLDLDNGVKGSTLNHARNMVHVQKRQAQMVARTQGSDGGGGGGGGGGGKLSSITEDHRGEQHESTLPALPVGPSAPSATPRGAFSPSLRAKPKPFLQAKPSLHKTHATPDTLHGTKAASPASLSASPPHLPSQSPNSSSSLVQTSPPTAAAAAATAAAAAAAVSPAQATPRSAAGYTGHHRKHKRGHGNKLTAT